MMMALNNQHMTTAAYGASAHHDDHVTWTLLGESNGPSPKKKSLPDIALPEACHGMAILLRV